MTLLAGKRVLLLEDEGLLRKALAAYLERQGADVLAVVNLGEARRVLAGESFDWALCDINLPDGSGLDLLREGAFAPTTGVVVMTAEGGLDSAVAALRAGAGDYLSKPFEPDELPLVFRRLDHNRRRARIEEHERARSEAGDAVVFFGRRLALIAEQMRRILEADARLQRHLPPILIEGETGTGKSSLARWIHRQGPRAAQPWIEINCSTLPENLAESELFGHEKGAFTDARQARIGLFEAADGGSLFLDEIGSLAPGVQAKVLSAIEERTIRRLGGNRTIAVDVRLIAASLRPLGEMVAAGQFREDLFHRLDLLRLRLPPLRAFPEDIPGLAEHLLDDLRRRYRLPRVTIGAAGAARLQAHGWPGNVRELRHELERALIYLEGEELNFAQLAQGGTGVPATAAAGDPGSLLNAAFCIPATGFAFERELESLTATVIAQALQRCNGNVSAAARLLGVSRDFVRYRIAPG
jgi:DNA-binding NtrC family response regulator